MAVVRASYLAGSVAYEKIAVLTYLKQRKVRIVNEDHPCPTLYINYRHEFLHVRAAQAL